MPELATDPATLGPRTDGWGRTSRPGIVAAGNLVHPGETAGLAALGGRAAGRRLAETIQRATMRPAAGSGPHRDARRWSRWCRPWSTRAICRTGSCSAPPAFTDRRLVVVRQGGREIGRHRLRHSVPNRSLGVPGAVVGAMASDGGPVELTLV